MRGFVYFYYILLTIMNVLLIGLIYKRYGEKKRLKKIETLLDNQKVMKIVTENHSSASNAKQSIAGFRSQAIKALIADNHSNDIRNFPFGEKKYL